MSNEPKIPDILIEYLDNLSVEDDLLGGLQNTIKSLIQTFEKSGFQPLIIKTLLQKLQNPTQCGYPTVMDIPIREIIARTLGEIGEKAATPEVLSTFIEILGDAETLENARDPRFQRLEKEVLIGLTKMGAGVAANRVMGIKVVDALIKLLPGHMVSTTLGAIGKANNNIQEYVKKTFLTKLSTPGYDERHIKTDRVNVLTPMKTAASKNTSLPGIDPNPELGY